MESKCLRCNGANFCWRYLFCGKMTPTYLANAIKPARFSRAPYYLLGAQQTSQQFWSLPIWNQIGVEQLAVLGETDPIYFTGWDMLDQLSDEIQQFNENIREIEFDTDIKASWLSHLVYCHNLLKMETPADAMPILSIG